MKINLGFWDSSAIIPLCCQQASSPMLRRLVRQTSRMVAWWGATVEVHSTLNRLLREGNLSAKEKLQAITRLDHLKKTWREVLPSEKVRERAENAAGTYNLRALDSFQLAAALAWSNDNPRGRLFVCEDIKLAEAAEKAGFSVLP
ncbi:MAG TPA: type II toxin-antitoxin system VapC family toxin [Blastocatellia bacterium]|nr:type II toxin-antitoxin system VapC family toxin [Blastocatellia bacterium]